MLTLDIADADTMRRDIAARIEAQDFPCVGAKSALARGTLEIVRCSDIRSAWDDLVIHRRLLEWARAYRKDPTGLRSIAFVFGQPDDLSEEQFENHMWERIQSLADKDAWLGQRYDHRVSPDPDDPHFSLSFGGEAFFVVGLHPHASRPARRMPWPIMVFNLHDQFEALRSDGRYEKMRKTILSRDEALAGTINPMLARHGEVSEARQYSGRVVDEAWRCPFSDVRAQ